MNVRGRRSVPKAGQYELETAQVFSQSVLWDFQRQAYAERGTDAWRQGEVPHYVTTNPTLANAYAETVFALLQDQAHLTLVEEPLYICELGAGSGRLAFHLLRQLEKLCASMGVPLGSFRYVLTDAAQSNLAFFRQHPRFREYFERGVLDLAHFDIGRSERLELQVGGTTIGPGDLGQPVTAIANYVFDCTPQDLFSIKDGRMQECLVSVTVDEDPQSLDASRVLEHMAYRFENGPLSDPRYEEPELQKLLRYYQGTLVDTHLLFPVAGLRCVERLRALSRNGLVLLSADKGDHRLSSLDDWGTLVFARDGGFFTVNVNYHAFKAYCEQGGGTALFPSNRHSSVNVGCLLMLNDPAGHWETLRAYRRHVEDFSPDDFFTLTRTIRKQAGEMSVQELLAYIRLSRYDSAQFAGLAPRLAELAPTLTGDERMSVVEAVERVWGLYFPLGEELDLAYELAVLLYRLREYERSLAYFERSIEAYGPYSGALYNMALCYRRLGNPERAGYLLRQLLEHEPHHEQARALLGKLAPRSSNQYSGRSGEADP